MLFVPNEEVRESSLKSTAILARTATLRYLYLVTDYLEKIKNEPVDEIEVVRILTENFFEGRTGDNAIDKGLAVDDLATDLVMPNGVITCSGLNADDDHAPIMKYRSPGENLEN